MWWDDRLTRDEKESTHLFRSLSRVALFFSTSLEGNYVYTDQSWACESGSCGPLAGEQQPVGRLTALSSSQRNDMERERGSKGSYSSLRTLAF